MSGGSNMGDALKQYAKASQGQGAANPQATAAPFGGMGAVNQQSMAPWMMGQMGGMGNQMMQAGHMPQMQAPMMRQHPMMGGPGQMAMPPPTMQAQQQMPQQPITPADMNQALAQQTGLMGGRQWQMPTIMRR